MVYRNLCYTYLFLCEECQVTLRRVFKTYISGSFVVAAFLGTYCLFHDACWETRHCSLLGDQTLLPVGRPDIVTCGQRTLFLVDRADIVYIVYIVHNPDNVYIV